MTYLAKYDFVILPAVKRAVALLLVKQFYIFQKIKKALSMLFLQYIMINLVLTKSPGLKRHVVSLTAPLFAGFCVYYTDLSGGASSYSSFPPTPGCTAPRPNFSLNNPSLTAVGRFAHRFVGDSAHRP